MKTTYLFIAGALASLALASCASGGNNVINTTEAGKGIRGYGGPTPLEVTVDNEGKIVKVVALPNSETPGFFKKVEEELLPKLIGKTSVEGIDAVTGATFSSNAVLENAKLALEEAKKR